MKNFLVNFVYKKYRKELEDKIVEEYYGFIPKGINEPVLEFLSSARNGLEPLFCIQAYKIQKRSIEDSKHAENYNGMLMHIRSLLVMIQRGKIEREEIKIVEKEDDPFEKVQGFLKGFKEKK